VRVVPGDLFCTVQSVDNFSGVDGIVDRVVEEIAKRDAGEQAVSHSLVHHDRRNVGAQGEVGKFNQTRLDDGYIVE